MSGRVLILYPEGNFNFNPHLVALIEMLCERGVGVDLLTKKWPEIGQKVPCEGCRLHDVSMESGLGQYLFMSCSEGMGRRLAPALRKKFPEVGLVLGVDRGIIAAAALAKILEARHALISYEIFFADELGEAFKHSEIRACEGVAFAVCQDRVRGAHLAAENKIPEERIVHSPVAGRGQEGGVSPSAQDYQAWGLEEGTQVALVMGSVDRWTMIEQTVRGVGEWPDSWKLVVHDRYGLARKTLERLMGSWNQERVVCTSRGVARTQDLGSLLRIASVGIGFYHATGESYCGKNVADIGLSSGKIATYLQYGLAVITNPIGEMADLILSYKAGRVVADPEELGAVLPGAAACRAEDCRRLFDEKLSAEVSLPPVLDRIEKALRESS